MNSSPQPNNGKIAIITGASRGIGAGLTSAYRGLGYIVIATALSVELSADAGIVTVAGDGVLRDWRDLAHRRRPKRRTLTWRDY
jgi:NAD(P)-dependent dehydrogenase (short-subunit alcohol dehydrogenase family)